MKKRKLRRGNRSYSSNNYFRMHNIHVRHHRHNNKAGLIVRKKWNELFKRMTLNSYDGGIHK